MTDDKTSIVDIISPLLTALEIFGLKPFKTPADHRIGNFRFSPPRTLIWSCFLVVEGVALMFYTTGLKQLRNNFNDVSTFFFCETIFYSSGVILLIQSLIKAKPTNKLFCLMRQCSLDTQEVIEMRKLSKRLLVFVATSAICRAVFSSVSYLFLMPRCTQTCWGDELHMRLLFAVLEAVVVPKMLFCCLMFHLLTKFIKTQFDKHYRNFEEKTFEQNWLEYKKLCELVRALDRVFAFHLLYAFTAAVFVICLCLFFAVSANDLEEGMMAFGNYDSKALKDVYYVFFMIRMVENFALIWVLLYCTAVGAVQLNQKSRRVRRLLLERELRIPPESFLQFHQFLSKTQDESWGLTAGHVFLVEKTTLIKIVSASFTLLVMWIRFNFSDKILSSKECVCPCAVNDTYYNE